MTKISWTDLSGKLPETGLSQGVLYLGTSPGVPWDGLASVSDAPSDVTEGVVYFDGERELLTQDQGPILLDVEAYIYPEEFREGDRAGLSYRVEHGSGYKIHLIYGAKAFATKFAHESESNTVSPSLFGWRLTTDPVSIPWSRPGTHLVVDATNARYPDSIRDLEDILYGTDNTDARLPLPEEVVELFESYVIFRITYNGDGTWAAEGPDDMIAMLDENRFALTSPSALYIDENTFQVESY